MEEKQMAIRYRVVNESVTGHCCFEASVVDLLQPIITGDGQAGSGRFFSVCECLEVARANEIAAALNATGTAPDVDDIAQELLGQYRNTDWSDLSDDEMHRQPNPHLPGQTYDTPPRNHWREIARRAIDAVYSSQPPLDGTR
jgi:hypothetical protein